MTLVVILETAPSSTLRDIEGIKCILVPFIVIDGGNGGLALGDVAVAVGISGMSGHNLVLGTTVGTLINGSYTFRYTPRIWNHVQSPAETPNTKPQVPSPLE